MWFGDWGLVGVIVKGVGDRVWVFVVFGLEFGSLCIFGEFFSSFCFFCCGF